jgi:membrane protease YdiL (CAAX protease family)
VTVTVVLANLLAAVAEEVWFRRLCYGLLAPAGPVVAVAGSSVLFALVHVSIYGFWILPLDLAAGAVLGWQRAVTGSCVSPAVTHMVANLLVLL